MATPVDVYKTSLPHFYSGSGTATATPQPLDPIPYEFLKGVTVSNDGASSIFIGPRGDEHFEIPAGAKSPQIPVESPTDVYVMSGGSVAYSWIGS